MSPEGKTVPETRRLVATGVVMEPAACPACGAGEVADPVLFEASDHLFGCSGSFSIVRCHGCRSLRVDPRPSPSSLGHFYQHYYSPAWLERAEALQIGTGNPRFDPVRDGSLARFGQLLKAMEAAEKRGGDGEEAPTLSLVDVGCGLGGFLHHISDQPGLKLLGVEMDEEAVAYARRRLGLEMRQGMVEDLPLPDDEADLLTMWHVLEHSPVPRLALREAARVLRLGGLLGLEVPHGRSLLASLFGPYWFYLQPPTHLHLFSRMALTRMLEEEGFEVVDVSYPFVPLELLGSLYYLLARPEGIPEREPSKAAAVAVGLGILLVELPVLTLLRWMRRSGVIRVVARAARS